MPPPPLSTATAAGALRAPVATAARFARARFARLLTFSRSQQCVSRALRARFSRLLRVILLRPQRQRTNPVALHTKCLVLLREYFYALGAGARGQL